MPALDLQEMASSTMNALRSGDNVQAFYLACQALASPKAGHVQHMLLAQSLGNIRLRQFDPVVRHAILSYLASNLADNNKVAGLWLSMLNLDPALKAIVDTAKTKSFEAADWDLVREGLQNQFITMGLRRLIITNPLMERFFRQVRAHILLELWPKGVLKTRDITFICALAEQCFLNEYAYDVSAEEEAAISGLPRDNPISVAILGCYAPLYGENIPPKLSSVTAFRQMMMVQVFEPQRERELRESVPSFGEIDDETSKNVRAMYEENPYPRWINVDLPPKKRPDVNGSMLIAGCGTGRTTVQAGYFFPNAEITSIDFTKRSIGYAMRKVEERGIEGVEFHHGDIMNVSMLGKTFDFVECSGVLHHMKDPVAGWRQLISVLNPGGKMMVCLYSTKGRAAVRDTRAHIEKTGYKPVPADIRRLRREIMDDPESPLKHILTSRDFYTTSEIRDLVFHVQETTYTMIELKKIFEELGLELERMRLPSPAIGKLYLERFPDDPGMTSFENWDKFEDEFPNTFGGMFKMGCKRKGDNGHNDAVVSMLNAIYND